LFSTRQVISLTIHLFLYNLFNYNQQKIGANDTDKITDTMYTNRENLEAIFRMIDLDSNGLISIDEFKQACELLTGMITTSNLSIVVKKSVIAMVVL